MDNIKINDTSFTEAEEAGTYPVIITHIAEDGTTTQKTIYVTLYRYNTVESIEEQEAIDAHDAMITKERFDNLTDQEIIQLLKAHAWDTKTGKRIPITTIKYNILNADLGLYSIDLATAKGTTTTVKLVVKEAAWTSVPMEYTTQSIRLYENTPEFFWHLELMGMAMLVIPVLVLAYHYWKERNAVKQVHKLLYSKRYAKLGLFNQ